MNLRQAQRVLAELVAKCEAAHVELPKDAIDARMRAVQALRHSQVDGKVSVDDALEEMQQALGIEPRWQQRLQDDADKRHRRQQAATKRKPKTSAVRNVSPTRKSQSRGAISAPGDEEEAKPRTQVIKERHPATNPANKELADEFVDLGDLELKRGETQKGISRMRVAKEIRSLAKPVTSGAQTRKLRGVGRSAVAKIDEFLNDGKIHALQEPEDAAVSDGDGERNAVDGSKPDGDAKEKTASSGGDGDEGHGEEQRMSNSRLT